MRKSSYHLQRLERIDRDEGHQHSDRTADPGAEIGNNLQQPGEDAQQQRIGDTEQRQPQRGEGRPISSIATSVPRTQPPSVRPRSEKSNAPPTRARSGARSSAKSRSLSALISQKTLIVMIRTILSKPPKTPETSVKGNWRSAGTLDCSEASACPRAR